MALDGPAHGRPELAGSYCHNWNRAPPDVARRGLKVTLNERSGAIGTACCPGVILKPSRSVEKCRCEYAPRSVPSAPTCSTLRVTTDAAGRDRSICVLVLAYARPTLLTDALNSVAAQTLAPTRVIVVDDASPSPLRDLVNVPMGLDCEFIRQPVNGGPASAAARALREANCDLVAFLNDDDLWEPSFLERLTLAMGDDPSVGVAFCDHYVIDDKGARDSVLSDECSLRYNRAHRDPGIVANLPIAALVEQAVAAQSFALWRRTTLDPSIVEAGGEIWDYYVSLSGCMSGCTGCYVPEKLGSYRLSSSSISKDWNRPSDRIASRARTIAADVLILRSKSLVAVHPFARRRLVRGLGGVCVTAAAARQASLFQNLLNELCRAVLTPTRPAPRTLSMR